MKRCTHCNDFSLYDDDVAKCPICGEALTTYIRRGAVQRNNPSSVYDSSYADRGNAVRPNNNSATNSRNSDNQRREAPLFERRQGLRYVYQGIITEITPLTRYPSRLKKIVNAIFLDEPYQLSHSTHMIAFRIEEFSDDRVAMQKRNCVFFGDVEGLFNVGDEATVTAKRKGSRNIVKRMFLNETGLPIRASFQIPAWLIRLLFFILLIFLWTVVSSVIRFFDSGIAFDAKAVFNFEEISAAAKELFTSAVAMLVIFWIFKELLSRK